MEIAEILRTVYLSFANPKMLVKTWDKRKIELTDGITAVAATSFISAIITIIIILAQGGTGGDTTILVAWGLFYVIVVYGLILNWLVDSVLIYVVASMLGGKGDFVKLATKIAFPSAAALLVAWMPDVAQGLSIITLLVALYAFYVVYLFLQPAMKLKSDKAVITLVITVIVYFVITMAVASYLMPLASTAPS